MSDNRGRFVWYDLMTSDPDAAQSFYTKLIGWGTEAWEGPMPYTMWTSQGSSLGGVMTLSQDAKKAGAPPNWLGYVHTPHLDETVSTAQENGGNVMVPATEIPKVGRFSVLADPQGAIFAAFTPEAQPPAGHDGPPRVGDFSWHELNTTDHDNAWGFYESLFGWDKADAMDMGEMGTYQMYKQKGADLPLGGMFNKPAEMPGPPFWLYYIRVDDVRASVEDVKKLGGQVLNGPMEVPGGDHVAQCMDPQGAAFALHSTKA